MISLQKKNLPVCYKGSAPHGTHRSSDKCQEKRNELDRWYPHHDCLKSEREVGEEEVRAKGGGQRWCHLSQCQLVDKNYKFDNWKHFCVQLTSLDVSSPGRVEMSGTNHIQTCMFFFFNVFRGPWWKICQRLINLSCHVHWASPSAGSVNLNPYFLILPLDLESMPVNRWRKEKRITRKLKKLYRELLFECDSMWVLYVYYIIITWHYYFYHFIEQYMSALNLYLLCNDSSSSVLFKTLPWFCRRQVAAS